jgi:GDP-L-fucose synthase
MMNGNTSVTIWGSGKPKREFLFVDDMAEASVFVMDLDQKKYQSQTEIMQSHLNVGFGSDITIHELAIAIKKIMVFEGEIQFDSNKPDGSPQKLMDSSRLNQLGWYAKTDLESGLNKAYQDFLLHHT